MASLNLPVIGQDTGSWGAKVNAALTALNDELVQTTAKAAANANGVLTSAAQTISGVKTFADKPVVPDGSFSVAKIAATGRVGDGTRALLDNGSWGSVASGGGGVGTGSANTLGTLANPVTDASAARPVGLTRVVWDCAIDPTNWAIGDYNLQKGT